MVFNSIPFVVFWFVVLLVITLSTNYIKSIKVRNIALLCSNYTFYSFFSFKFTILLVYVTLINYISGLILTKLRNKAQQLITLWISIILTIAPLLFYKYSIFILSNIFYLADKEFAGINIILPIGISFFTFQVLSYTIDIYRGKISPCTNIIEFGAFTSFFPTILSGPIERARNLLPQLRKSIHLSIDGLIGGISLFCWGLFKKMVIADRLAQYIDWAYSSSSFVSGSTLLIAVFLYSFQIYCDFSGYSDMAIGVARTLGFDVMQNFKFPYFAHSIKEFWRRWHISLTSWFTEYVYFSLGGSRVKTTMRWVVNISLIFILSGIWHGAAWNFVIWGALHAILYLIEYGLHLQPQKEKSPWKYFKSIYVFIFVSIAWVFFRVEDISTAWLIIGKAFTEFNSSIELGSSAFNTAETFALFALFMLLEFLSFKGILMRNNATHNPCALTNLLLIVGLLIGISLFGVSASQFVYFQF